MKQARKLIDDGAVDVDTEWSDAAPSADDGNAEIEAHGYDGYGAWHLAIDPDASEETKGRYSFRPSSTASSARRRTTTTSSRRRSTICCSGWTPDAPDGGKVHLLVTVPVARDTRSVTSGA